MASNAWKEEMLNIVNEFISMPESEPFRAPVDWKALGLPDYPIYVKKPMDLGTVKSNLQKGVYRNHLQAAEDIRLIWTNCMKYNMEGSDLYLLAKRLQGLFEERYNRPKTSGLLEDLEPEREPTTDEQMAFCENLYKISSNELGEVIQILDERCPAALEKRLDVAEVEINVDRISPYVFFELNKLLLSKLPEHQQQQQQQQLLQQQQQQKRKKPKRKAGEPEPKVKKVKS